MGLVCEVGAQILPGVLQLGNGWFKWVTIVWYVVQVVTRARPLNESRLLGVGASQTQLIHGKKSSKEVAGKYIYIRKELTGPQISIYISIYCTLGPTCEKTDVFRTSCEFPAIHRSRWAQAQYSPLALILYACFYSKNNEMFYYSEMHHDGLKSLHVSISSFFPKACKSGRQSDIYF